MFALELAAGNVRGAVQDVVPVEGAGFLGELASIDANKVVTFRTGGEKERATVRSIPLKDLVRWGCPVGPRAQTVVVLADGGQFVTAADWSGGAAVRLDGKNVVLLSDVWNEVKLPQAAVSAVVFAQQRRVDDRERMVERVRKGVLDDADPDEFSAQSGAAKSSSDAVLLTNGDRLTGKLSEIESGSLAVDAEGGTAKVPLSRVEMIVLGRQHHILPIQPHRRPATPIRRSYKLPAIG